MKIYTKGETVQLSPNFKTSEFHCKGKNCCDSTLIDEKLVEWLQKIRDHFGVSVNVNSGYRCEKHNKNVGGSSSSHHMKGMAADIVVKGKTPREVAQYAEKIGVQRIGLYETDKDGYFVHIGSGTSKRFWYGQAGKIVDTFQDTVTSSNVVPEGNSSLVTYVNLSPNKNSPRNHKIDTITIHCVVGQLTAKQIVNLDKFQNSSGKSSCNYAVGTDGSIGLCVEEKDRAWTSSSRDNDHRAITIEVASDMTAPYAVNDKAMNALIELVADICKRNNIKELKWKADKSLIGQVDKQNMTAHRWFASTECPGDYLYERFDDIATAVNKKLGVTSSVSVSGSKPVTTITIYRVRKSWNDATTQVGAYNDLDNAKKKADSMGDDYFVFDSKGNAIYPEVEDEDPVVVNHKVGDLVKLVEGATYTNGKAIPKWVFNSKLYVREVRASGENIVFSTQKSGQVTGVTKSTNLIPYVVSVSGSSGTTTTQKVDPNKELEVGDEVRITSDAVYFTGKKPADWVYTAKLYIREIRSNGDAVISTVKSGPITGVMNKKYLRPYNSFDSYKVTVNVNTLNVRASATTSSAIVNQIKKGTVHTITDEEGKWGKISSGWIYLPYVKKNG